MRCQRYFLGKWVTLMRKLLCVLPLLISLFVQLAVAQSGSQGTAAASRTQAPDSSTPPPIEQCSQVPFVDVITGQSTPADKTDTMQPSRFCRALTDLFAQERFEALDRIAEQARKSKSRFSGGGWKLYSLYTVVTYEPSWEVPDAVWEKHVERLQRWCTQRPDSITAQIALSRFYENFAVKARGSDYADKVSPEDWALFQQRLRKSREILEKLARQGKRDPHWFYIMSEIARYQGWDENSRNALLEHAISFEPLYYYVYQEYILTLLPQWYGNSENTDILRFSEDIAKRIGGEEGDIAYFHIAHEAFLIPSAPFQLMSWQRIRAGFEATERKYGVSPMKLNWMCSMAHARNHNVYAATLFERVGKNWDRGTWGNWQTFKASRQSAYAVRDITRKQDLNSEKQVGFNNAVTDVFRTHFGELLNTCVRGKSLSAPFDFYVEISGVFPSNPRGAAQEINFMSDPELSDCLTEGVRGKVVFPLWDSRYPEIQNWARVHITQPQRF